MWEIKRASKMVTAERGIVSDWLIIRVPYLNCELIQRYLIVFRIHLPTCKGEASIQVNRIDGSPAYTMYALAPITVDLKQEDVRLQNIEFVRFINTLAKFGDFAYLEEVIMKVENDLTAQKQKRDGNDI